MVVYIDVVLLENLSMNYIILLATSIIGNRKVNFLKILVASFIGGIYSIVNYVLDVSLIINLLFKLLISLIMIRIVFHTTNFKGFFKLLILFYLVSLTFGGTAFMLLFVINPKGIIFEGGHLIGTYPIKIAILGGIIGFTIIAIVSNILRNIISNQICEVEIFYKGKSEKIKSFIDSGNLLKEPISMADVIVVEKSSLEEILDLEFLNNMKHVMNGNLITSGDDFIKAKIKLIPFSSLGNENGILIGFKPDYIKIYSDEIKVTKNVIVGIYDGKLTKSNLYTSLIGLNILKESDVDGKFISNI